MRLITLSILSVFLIWSCTQDQSKTTTNTGSVMTQEISAKNKASVIAFFKALEEENIETLVDLFAVDAVHINPYSSGLFPEGAKGREGIKNYWTPVFPNFDGMTFTIESLHAMEDAPMVYVKYHGKIKHKGSETYYENDYYSTFTFNSSGQITEYVEIFNPIVAARGFGLLEQIK